MDNRVTAEVVEDRLLEAGRTLQALRVPGVAPSGFRSGMPEVLPQGLAQEFGADYLKHVKPEYRVDPPTAAAIRDMDTTYQWVTRYIPGQVPAAIRQRRAVFQRSLLNPTTDRHVHSFRKIGDKLNISHTYAQTLWEDGLDRIAAGLRRDRQDLPMACSTTLARIRGFQALLATAGNTVARDLVPA